MVNMIERARALYPMLKETKDDIHRHPELAFHETRTTGIIKDRLAKLGIEQIDIGMETGAVGFLRGGKPGPTVALRADIDAIEQQEPADNGVVSEYDGVMHGCGHDFHTTCLLGAAQMLSERRAELCGNVVFLFQPAEEITEGAAAMVAHGLWDKLPERPVRIFGLHDRPEIPCGQVAVIPGAIMAGKSDFSITLAGVTGHCGSPHKCVDVIVAGAAIVDAVQTIVSRNTDPLEPLTCAVFSINAGTPENFVPETLTMTGDIRAHSDEVLMATRQRLQEMAESIAASYRCKCKVEFVSHIPVTYNKPEMVALARKAAGAVFQPEDIVQPKGGMGSEDFAFFGQDVPSFFYWLGTGFPGQPNACWHNEHFKVDDDALPLGAALLAESALAGLEG
ncbi:amidohydrolase [Pseudoflavonifractor sp. MSJ-37]|nr:amidohydrolase [Pseudoflavonifractor sp. MSJ-37]